MVRGVNTESAARRAQRVADTEARLIEAARRLFLRHGYAGTTLTAVADEAGLAPRTVYVRFGTKVALFRRTLDVAVVGDTARVDVAHREWTQRSLTAPTLEQRIQVATRKARDIMSRVGPLLPVAEQAAALEPAIAEAAQSARAATRDHIRQFWVTAAQDGLLPSGTDVNWLADTSGILAAADTYLHIRRTLDWTPDQYEQWLLTTWWRLLSDDGQTSRPSKKELSSARLTS
jgi:AcrR family transcriptional regulator